MTVRWSTAKAILAIALTLVPLRPSDAAEPVVTLSLLEQRLPNSLSLQAAQQHVEFATQAVSAQIYKSGLQYFVKDATSFHNDVVTNSLNNTSLSYGQRIGLQWPLLGTKFDENAAILSTQTDAVIARITYDDMRRQILSKLRESYVTYWQSFGQAANDQNFVGTLVRELPSARALLTTGFWTTANFADFRASLTEAQTDLQSNRNSLVAQLASLRSILNQPFKPFQPVDPAFSAGCSPTLDVAVRSATSVDLTIAKLDAQILETKTLLRKVSGSSIEANAQASAGAVFNVPPRIGYNIGLEINATVPTHMRSQEHAHQRQLEAQLAEITLQEKQARLDVAGTVESALNDFTNADLVLTQAVQEEKARQEDLRTARVRFQTVNAPSASPFNDVQTATIAYFQGARDTIAARAKLYLAANHLLLLSPGACGGS
ncbi:MAG: TolC family protein [Vulcanimicrobiaceae bacterium]